MSYAAQTLTDKYARRFNYLRLSLTESCNFRCNYCLPDGLDCDSRRDEITQDEIRRLVHAFALAGTKKIRLTGGEPSLRRDLTDVIRICKETPGIETVALTTNGYRLKRDIDAWVDAGLDAVNVSVDSLNPYTFQMITQDNRLDLILDGIDAALEKGITQVKANAVLLKDYNAHEMPLFMDYIREKSVTFRFIELMQTGDNSAYYRRHHVSGESLKKQLLQDGWRQVIRPITAGPAQEFAHPDYQGNIGLIMPYSKDFCDTCNRLRVSSRAQLFLCLFTDHHNDLRRFLQDDDPDALIEHLQAVLMGKKETHFLHQEFTGATRHLAMIGG